MKRQTRSTCCYCGVGCGVLIDSEDERIVAVQGDPDHPANRGRLCTKGAALHRTTLGERRLLHPALRGTRDSAPVRVGWDTALEHAAERFAGIIQRHGPDSVAFYVSGQLLSEDYHVFNKLARGLVGTNNIDSNSRLCMSSAVVGYKQTLGADAPPCCYDDIGASDCLLIAGANPALAHPILFRRIEDARADNPQLKIVVIDPRRSETAAVADLHLPVRPGTDIVLFNAMLHVLIAEDLIDRDYIARHTHGFAAIEALVAAHPLARAAERCGVPADDIVRAARWFGGARAALSLYCQGLNQSIQGSANNAALIDLHLACGQIGRPGAGPFSLTGQPNAMGGRETGALATLLPGHRDPANPAHREEVARLWGVPALPSTPGKSAVELFAAVRRGEIKAVWIACTNPAHSMPDQGALRAALRAAEFVVLQEAFAGTETADHADLLLPATTWGEKEGTVTNSERRITRVRAAVGKPGEARHDWEIAADFARRLAPRLGRPQTSALFAYSGPEAIFAEHRESTRGRDLDIGGLSYALLERDGPQQWPFPAGATRGTARLYADGVFPTADGRARFVPVEARPPAEVPDARRPLSLLSGRLRDQWHGMSRTGNVPHLFKLDAEALLSLHPCDMQARGLSDGDLVTLSSARASIVLRVGADRGLAPGVAWLPMHWGERFMNSPGVNALTLDAVDPQSRQPELKHAAVSVERVDLPWPLVVIRRGADAAATLAYAERARALLPRFPHATLGLYGSGAGAVVLRAALAEPLPEAALAEIDACFALDDPAAIVFADPQRAISKRAIAPGGILHGVRLAGEVQAAGWLREALSAGTPDPALTRWALAPLAQPPAALPERSPVVCKCADVSEAQIRGTLAATPGAQLETLQARLKCGTFCGACVPELRQLLSAA